MKTNLIRVAGVVSLSALFVGGCADSSDYEQGSAPVTETGSSSAVTNTDPGVANEPGTYGTPANQSPETQFNALGSASAPSATVPANLATNETGVLEKETSEAANAQANQQGNQTSPEPNTGDDVNPDQVNPERK